MDKEIILKYCRICVVEKPNLVKFTQTFESGGVKSVLRDIFNDCSPIKIDTNDGLPDKFCIGCLSELLKAYEFRQKCRKATILFKNILQDFNQSKRKRISETEQEESSSKFSKRDLGNIDFENVIVKNEIIFQNSSDDENDPEQEDHDYSEDEEPMPSTSSTVRNYAAEDNYHKANVKLKDMQASSSKLINPVKLPEVKTPVSELKAVYHSSGYSKIVLQKKEDHPDLGVFKITVMRGYKNSSHVVYEANGFLYVNTRNTAQRRYLRCSTSRNCPGKACIDVKPHNEMEEYLYVYKLHNHPKETLHITKLKFLEQMRCIAAVGNFTPKQVYELAIKNFPELKNVMTYNTLSSRLYRLAVGASSQNQSIDSLKKFGLHLAKDRPTKYCNTQEGEQFFQEALIDEDNNTCSLIYANTSLIENMSWSNELFVDSSFKINFDNGANYHFLTICISVNEHRFPIFFALMDTATQEEYTKVLTLFKDEYAPSLHPEEIVTDFDAALFKALTDVYKHSSISGSLIHYIFHIYKQCNVEDIIKDIELRAECTKMQSNLFALPILSPHMVPAGLQHLMNEAKSNGTYEVFSFIFRYIESVWIDQVTPQVFSSFCNMSSVNENIVNTYKKIRDIISSNKKFGFFDMNEKLIQIEDWVSVTYQKVLSGEKLPRQFACSKYAKVLDRLWQPNQIEKYGYTAFFESVGPLIEKMTGLIWIWGFYNYNGLNDELLITPHDYFGTESIDHVLDTSETDEHLAIQVEEDVIVESEHRGTTTEGEEFEEDQEVESELQDELEAEHAELEDGQEITFKNVEEQVITLQFIKPGLIVQKD